MRKFQLLFAVAVMLAACVCLNAQDPGQPAKPKGKAMIYGNGRPGGSDSTDNASSSGPSNSGSNPDLTAAKGPIVGKAKKNSKPEVKSGKKRKYRIPGPNHNAPAPGRPAPGRTANAANPECDPEIIALRRQVADLALERDRKMAEAIQLGTDAKAKAQAAWDAVDQLNESIKFHNEQISERFDKIEKKVKALEDGPGGSLENLKTALGNLGVVKFSDWPFLMLVGAIVFILIVLGVLAYFLRKIWGMLKRACVI